jgi:hypothetical protein
MKLVWIGAFLLLFASLAALISNRQSGRLIEETWATATKVLPDSQISELRQTTPAFAAKLFGLLPEPFREKFAARTRNAVELMTFRLLVLCHVTPALLVPLIVGFLEGSWSRANQKALVKVHSPLRFSLALTTLGLSPVLALLWVTAPIAISGALLVLALSAIVIFGTRNLIVHGPTQF